MDKQKFYIWYLYKNRRLNLNIAFKKTTNTLDGLNCHFPSHRFQISGFKSVAFYRQ